MVSRVECDTEIKKLASKPLVVSMLFCSFEL